MASEPVTGKVRIYSNTFSSGVTLKKSFIFFVGY
jgi:hypothetical protein